MSSVMILWLGERAMEKVFTSLRLVLWAMIWNKISSKSTRLLMMIEKERNSTFLQLLQRLNFRIGECLHSISDQQRETMKNLMKNSTKISVEDEQRWMIDVTETEKDYLIRSSKDTSIRFPDDPLLYEKLFTFEQIVGDDPPSTIVHFCDLQSEYQCELFVILSKILFPQYEHIPQSFVVLAPAVLNDDRITTIYDEQSVEIYLKDVLEKLVNERSNASPEIALALFKLQLICRKQNSTLHLRPVIESNHDAIFLLYTGARILSILNAYQEKYQQKIYPQREYYHDKLEEMLTTKDERDFLQWIHRFPERFFTLPTSSSSSSKVHLHFDKIFKEWILFSRRLSPYYSKVRILTENQSHLFPTMFARLELLDRLVDLLRSSVSLLDLSLIDRM